MIELGIVVLILLSLAAIVLLVLIYFRPPVVDVSQLHAAIKSTETAHERTERTVRDEIARNRTETTAALTQSRAELTSSLKTVNDSTMKTLRELSAGLQKINESTVRTLSEVGASQRLQLGNVVEQLTKLREVIDSRLKELQADNAAKLDKMRETVDEKLQGTLEKRLGESFKLVSERLEAVQKGLGEMQSLATGVGDLKRVLTNVKTRGTFGELQLERMLEEVLTPDQYAKNVATKGGGERVEFAIKLPGRSGESNQCLLLPIDAKFPVEDYQRLVEAQERADLPAVNECGKRLEERIRLCAQDICDKYINPPTTTDFAILYLPTEGLFAEVVRRVGLPEYLHRECRVLIAGPTTLYAILNSLQMGFRTLAIEKRSSEVWTLLSAIKTEWGKYGDVLQKVQKKLNEASNTIDDVQKRSRAIGRKLKSVGELPSDETERLLGPPMELDVAEEPSEE